MVPDGTREACHGADATGRPPRRPDGFRAAAQAPSATARSSARNSSVSRCRQVPGRIERSARGPIRVRTSRMTGCPTASHMRRTWRLRPSWMTRRRTFGSTGVTRAGAVTPSSSSTPSRNCRRTDRVGDPSTCTTYSFSTPYEGWVMRLAISPSLVKSRSPSVSRSRRPTGKTRGSSGTRPTTTGRPWGSSAVVTTPTGLLSR